MENQQAEQDTTTKISIYLHEDDKRLIEASAKDSYRSLSQYCLFLIHTGLKAEMERQEKALTQSNSKHS